MNKLVIIGNGFDLAHGLNTSYSHFIVWCLKQYGSALLHGLGKEVSDGLCSIKMNDKINLSYWALVFQGWYFQRENPFIPWKETDAFFETIKDKDLCEFKIISPLFKRIWKQVSLGWVDIENEYFSLLTEEKISMENGFIQPNYKELNSHLDILRDKLIEYLKSESEKDCPVNDKINEIIYRPIKEREISVSFKKKLDSSISSDVAPNATMFLNFNYTNTPEKYVLKGSDTIVNYIHGNLDNPESVIFGYGDELDSSFVKLQNMNDNECLRHIKSIRYLESDNYRKMLDFIEADTFQVIIIGHSCGNSDRTLLNTLFEHRNCVSIKPYYYVKEDGTDNYLDIIQNISRNFTDMKLMRDRVVNKTYCESIK